MGSEEMKIRLEEGSSDADGFVKSAAAVFAGRFGYMLETSRSLDAGIAREVAELPSGWEKNMLSLVLFDEQSEIRAEPGGNGICYRILSEKEGSKHVCMHRDIKCLLAKVRQAKPFFDVGLNSLLSKEYFVVEEESGMLVKFASRLALPVVGSGE